MSFIGTVSGSLSQSPHPTRRQQALYHPACRGFLYLYFTHKKIGDGFTKENLLTSPEPESKKNTVKSLFKTAIPIGAGSIFFNIASFMDVTLILERIRHVMLLDPETLLSQYKISYLLQI